MKEASPRRGDWSDEPTGLRIFGRIRPVSSLWQGSVRTCSSNADGNQSNATPTDSARSQSERDLDLPAGRRKADEGRASGRREHRPERTENDAVGVSAVPSAGWRAVAEALDASGGMRP